MTEGFKYFFSCYFLPVFLIIMAAPMSEFMPNFNTRVHQDEFARTWTGPNKRKQERTRDQEKAGVMSALVGVILFVVVVIVDVFLPIEQETVNTISLALGIIATIIWLFMGRKARKNAKKYK